MLNIKEGIYAWEIGKTEFTVPREIESLWYDLEEDSGELLGTGYLLSYVGTKPNRYSTGDYIKVEDVTNKSRMISVLLLSDFEWDDGLNTYIALAQLV